jgi:hypothetical protein
MLLQFILGKLACDCEVVQFQCQCNHRPAAPQVRGGEYYNYIYYTTECYLSTLSITILVLSLVLSYYYYR